MICWWCECGYLNTSRPPSSPCGACGRYLQPEDMPARRPAPEVELAVKMLRELADDMEKRPDSYADKYSIHPWWVEARKRADKLENGES